MNQLQHDLQAEQIFTNKHHALLSPISHLPPEILSKIFILCLPSDRPPKVALYPRAWLLLGQICGYWRDVALSTPRLWTSLHLTLWAGSDEFDLEMVNAWLARSTPCPLTLTLSVNSSESAESIQAGIDVLMQHSNRWEDVTLDLGPYSFRTLSAIRNSLSCMKTLSVDIPWPSQYLPTFDAFEFAPQLRSLETGCYFSPSMLKIPWAQLTNCVFNFSTVQECLEAFHQTAHLLTCKVIIPEHVVESSSQWPHVYLDQLTSMTVILQEDATIFFDHLTLPALQNLYYFNGSGPSFRRLNSLLARSACALRTLVLGSTLETRVPEDEFLELLRIVPSLVELSLQCGISTRGCVELTDRRSENALASCLVERLEILRICRPFGFDDQAFADMIQSRWRTDKASRRSEYVGDQEWGAVGLAAVEIRVRTIRMIPGYTIDPIALSRFREFRDEGLDIYGLVDDGEKFEL